MRYAYATGPVATACPGSVRMSRASRIEVTAVAKVTIQRTWPDGDVLAVAVKAASNYPDALAEASRTALNAYREALGVTTADEEQS